MMKGLGVSFDYTGVFKRLEAGEHRTDGERVAATTCPLSCISRHALLTISSMSFSRLSGIILNFTFC